MPTTTFQKLAQKKRLKFLQAAYTEFSIHTYEGASITNLVKTLGIAKGSVYQYFEDKEELYKYLVGEVNRQINELLDKACPYDGDEFYNWYTRLLLVQLKYFLSFPSHTVLLQNVTSGVLAIDRNLKEEIFESQRKRIKLALPNTIANSEIAIQLLIKSPLMVFNLLTTKLNLAKVVSSNDPINLDSGELMKACNDWTEKLKSGL